MAVCGAAEVAIALPHPGAETLFGAACFVAGLWLFATTSREQLT